LIGHLESWVSLLDDSDLSASLATFYEYLRAEILRLQSSSELDEFMNLALLVCQTRATWQQRQSAGPSRTEAGAEPPHLVEGSDGSTPRFLVSA
jgi:flagellin-specific chaperone FliS